MKIKRQFKDDLVVLHDERYVNSIVPENRKQLNRKVHLHNEVHLEGSIWCNQLTLEGSNITITKSVHAEDFIELTSDSEGSIIMNGIVSAKNNIQIAPQRTNIYVIGAVTAEKVILKNAFIVGNVYCSEAIIENSVVLGKIKSQDLKIKNSIVSTTASNSVEIQENIGMLFPYISGRKISATDCKTYQLLDIAFRERTVYSMYEVITSDSIKEEIQEDGQVIEILTSIDRIFDLKGYTEKIKENIVQIMDLVNSFQSKKNETKELFEFRDYLFGLIDSKFSVDFSIPTSDFFLDENTSEDEIKVDLEDNTVQNDEPEVDFDADDSVLQENESQIAEETGSDESFTGDINEGDFYSESTPDPSACPNCKTPGQTDFLFCMECGHKIKK